MENLENEEYLISENDGKVIINKNNGKLRVVDNNELFKIPVVRKKIKFQSEGFGRVVQFAEIDKDEDLSQIEDVFGYMDDHYKFLTYESKDFTFVEWCYEWLETGALNIKNSTRSSYKAVIDNHIKRVFKDEKLEDITLDKVQKFIISLTKGIGLPDPVSNKTIKNIHGVVHKALSVAIDRNFIALNPADKVVLPKFVRKDPHPMNTRQIKSFFDAIAHHGKRDLFLLTLFTGMREGEVIGLTWDCYDDENGTLTVYRQIIYNREKKIFEFGTLKNDKSRVIALTRQAKQILDDLRKKGKCSESEFIFKNSEGDHYSEAAVYNSFKKVVKKMGYPELTFHDLRHTFAVLSLRANVDPKTVQETLGHFSSAFTLDVYCRALDEMKLSAAVKISDYIDSITNGDEEINDNEKEKNENENNSSVQQQGRSE